MKEASQISLLQGTWQFCQNPLASINNTPCRVILVRWQRTFLPTFQMNFREGYDHPFSPAALAREWVKTSPSPNPSRSPSRYELLTTSDGSTCNQQSNLQFLLLRHPPQNNYMSHSTGMRSTSGISILILTPTIWKNGCISHSEPYRRFSLH